MEHTEPGGVAGTSSNGKCQMTVTIHTDININDRLSYDITPENVQGDRRPAMWGNGQLELFADLERACINQVVCFGFGDKGLSYEKEQHLLPAVYDDERGKKYLLDAPRSSGAQEATVNFRPDRQTWRYTFDDLSVTVGLILPRMRPGYLLKLDIIPHDGNRTKRWSIYHELRGHLGNILLATEAGSDLSGGTAWCMSKTGKGETVGSTVDAKTINLGLDYDYSNGIMIKTVTERNGDAPDTIYFARAFGAAVKEAKENLKKLLSSPEILEAESEAWWNQYLNEVPRLDIPDETFAQTFLWSWPNFRMNRIDVPIGKTPAGVHRDNFSSLKIFPAVVMGNAETEPIQLLHDPRPARESMLYWLRETRQLGLFSSGVVPNRADPGNYVQCLGWFCGLLHKYLLTTNDFGLLDEPIGDGSPS